MSSYIYNGGTAVTVGDYAIKTINAYEVTWTAEIDSFTNWDYTTVELFKGNRFSVEITTIVDESEKTKLVKVLNEHVVNLICPDFEGEVTISKVSAPIRSSNFNGTYYKITFTATAVALVGGSGSL